MAYTGSFLRKMKIRGFYSLSDCVFSITACHLLMLAGKGLHEIYLIWGASRCLAEASWGGKMGPETISGIRGLWKPPREYQGLKIESPADSDEELHHPENRLPATQAGLSPAGFLFVPQSPFFSLYF